MGAKLGRIMHFLIRFRRSFLALGSMMAAALALGLQAQDAPQRVYVLRTGDDASDTAVVSALRERGLAVNLGVRVSQLATAQVRLSDCLLYTSPSPRD